MAQSTRALLGSLLLLLALAIPSHAALNNEVTQWVYEAQKTVAAHSLPNQLGARLYATVGLSQWEALKAARAKPPASDLAAVIYASHYVLATWYPQRQTAFYDPLIARHFARLNLTEAVRSASERVGVAAARKILATRLEDNVGRWGRFTPAPQNTTASRGKYQATPGQTTFQFPHFGGVKTGFASKDFREGLYKKYKSYPQGLSDPEYLKDLAEVTAYGELNSTVRSAYDSNSPRFWAQGAGTSGIAGSYLNISYALLPSTFGLYSTVRFFAAYGAATWDASVICYSIKYLKPFWRPITAIRYGDGVNTAIPTWNTLIATPVHPEYPSGHQCTTGAAVEVIQRVLGGDAFNFTLTPEGAPDLTRSYTSLNQAANEAGNARIFGGVHFRKANTDGQALARETARYVLRALGFK